ncbi:MAG: hypothetical protein RL689_924 [Planctomycetota bacterium]|jgi:hypothetical protein
MTGALTRKQAMMSRSMKAGVAGLVLAAIAGAAAGQTALGTGRGLEADLSTIKRGNAPRPDFMAEVRMRNDLVTGNATGGRSFRGDVGYRSADEFRGALGEDDLFSFRRDSVGAGAAGIGFRGTGSLQYQYSYSTANQFNGADSPTMSRLGGATGVSKLEPAGTMLRQPRRVSTDSFSGLGDGWELLAPRLGTLRSTSTFNSLDSLNPTMVGERTGARGEKEWMTASSLLGFRVTQPKRTEEPPPGSLARPTGAQRLNQPAQETDEKERLNKEVRTSYAELLERMEQEAGKLGVQPSLGTQPDREPAKETAPGAEPGKEPAKEGEPSKVEEPGWQGKISELREQLRAPRTLRKPLTKEERAAGMAGRTDAKADDSSKPQFDAATLALIRKGGGEVGSYTLSTVEKDLYSRYMTDGAAALAQGRYFDAEEQFARCLALSPGDPMASAARINSQLGAALFLSAAVNLHELLERHPEMAGIRYTGETIPPKSRLTDVAEVLRERIAKAKAEKGAVPEEAGFLLAYVGFQLGEQSVIDEGFAALDASAAATGPNAAMLELIKGVWKTH